MTLTGQSGSYECLRLTVESVDGGFASGYAVEAAAEVSLSLQRPELKDIAGYIRPGDRLNLVRAKVDDGGTADADLVVYHPDYLINITTIASCFQTFGTDARIAILNKFAASENTAAINLGNFASMILDEEIHGGARPYNESLLDFFRANAVNLATCDIPSTFHKDAGRQIDNIHAAISDHLPHHVADFDRRKVMLEPAFFSEMLGLQGRMDLLQLDYRVLIEQKSGKGLWPQGDYSVPRYTGQHYVQLLLYRAIMEYNYADRFEDGDVRLNSYLLYSRYTRPLVALGQSPGLLQQAIGVRNTLAAFELRLARGESEFLQALRADDLCASPETGGKLWRDYQRPRFQSLLAPLVDADSLERAYFYRMLHFVALEHTLSKCGGGIKPASGFASTWICSLEEKLDAGNIFCNLSLIQPLRSHIGKVETVTLAFADDETEHLIANFREGDLVILYSYPVGGLPDARRAMVHRASVKELSDSTVTLTLRFAQSSPRPFISDEQLLWAIEHDYMEASHTSLYRGLHSFLTAPRDRRDLILMRRRPTIDATRTLVLDHGGFNNLALRVAQARDLFLIIGPPGTGKTSYGLMTTLKEQLAADPASSVLLLAFTNRAVDEICSKLVEEGFDFLRIGPELSCGEEYLNNMLSRRASKCGKLHEVRHLITDSRIVVGTTASMCAASNLFQLRTFDLAIIDEASQLTEPNLLPLLSATTGGGKPVISKIVMIGDHKQLPAVVQQSAAKSAVTDPELQAAGLTDCRVSLFERFLRRYGSDPDITYMLQYQGRMHAEIADYAATEYYGSKLHPVPLAHQTAPLEDRGGDSLAARIFNTSRIAFADIKSEAGPGSDKVNVDEARFIAETAAEIARREGGIEAATLGVIVPYRNQIAAVKAALQEVSVENFDRITVDTVERFQGSQRKYIIYGLTIKRPYQLEFLCDNTFTDVDGTEVDRKLNVALTRAREYMLIVGNGELLRESPHYRRLIEYLESRHATFTC
ncbi:MAG: AAA family ATPase [Bacteroidales bacterium]|nr:AAA family ATPase [Bacteroidales bacterium]